MNPDGPVAMAKAAPLVSVVIPTFREAVNLPVIVPQVAGALAQRGWSVEILVADDDSRDGTEEVCRELAERWPLRLITRIGQRGLSGAVLRGLQDARGQVLVVMDADLSHPPEKVPELIDALDEEEVDFVLGSRYIGSGTRSPAVPKSRASFRRRTSDRLLTRPLPVHSGDSFYLDTAEHSGCDSSRREALTLGRLELP